MINSPCVSDLSIDGDDCSQTGHDNVDDEVDGQLADDDNQKEVNRSVMRSRPFCFTESLNRPKRGQ